MNQGIIVIFGTKLIKVFPAHAVFTKGKRGGKELYSVIIEIDIISVFHMVWVLSMVLGLRMLAQKARLVPAASVFREMLMERKKSRPPNACDLHTRQEVCAYSVGAEYRRTKEPICVLFRKRQRRKRTFCKWGIRRH